MAHCNVQGPSAVSCAKRAELIETPFGLWSRTDPGNHVLDGDPDPHAQRVQFSGQKGASPGYAWPCATVDILKATQQRAASVWCAHQLACTTLAAHWHHLANTTEPSACGSDAALCQVILTT